MKMSPVVRFEMPAKDRKRMSKFYTKAFGWQTNQLGQDLGNYVVVTTTETDEKLMVKTPGTINGGFYQKTKNAQYPSVVVSVDNIYEAMKRVKDSGGKILGGQKAGEPDDIPGIGLYVSFLDTEVNRVGMLEPKGM